MKCNHSETEYCDGPAVRFAIEGKHLVARCENHVRLGIGMRVVDHWVFEAHEISEEEAELWLVHSS